MTFDRSKVRVVKNVTMPTLSLKNGQSVFVKITGAIFAGKELKPAKEGETTQKPADLAPVVNLETGEIANLIVGAVVKANLIEAYPKDTYVGHSFEIAKGNQRAGKRYFDYRVTEIAIDENAATDAAKDGAEAAKAVAGKKK